MTHQSSTSSATPTPVPSFPFTTRDQVEAKLLHHMELGFGHSFARSTPVAHHATARYLAILIAKHFRLPQQAASDAVTASATIADLISKICELLSIPNPDLF